MKYGLLSAQDWHPDLTGALFGSFIGTTA